MEKVWGRKDLLQGTFILVAALASVFLFHLYEKGQDGKKAEIALRQQAKAKSAVLNSFIAIPIRRPVGSS